MTVEDISPDGYVTALAAVAAASERYQYPSTVDVAASLFRLTDPATIGADPEVDGRPVWVVRYSGINEPVGGPWVSGRPSGPDRVLQVAYVLMDAESADFLYRISTE